MRAVYRGIYIIVIWCDPCVVIRTPALLATRTQSSAASIFSVVISSTPVTYGSNSERRPEGISSRLQKSLVMWRCRTAMHFWGRGYLILPIDLFLGCDIPKSSYPLSRIYWQTRGCVPSYRFGPTVSLAVRTACTPLSLIYSLWTIRFSLASSSGYELRRSPTYFECADPFLYSLVAPSWRTKPHKSLLIFRLFWHQNLSEESWVYTWSATEENRLFFFRTVQSKSRSFLSGNRFLVELCI